MRVLPRGKKDATKYIIEVSAGVAFLRPSRWREASLAPVGAGGSWQQPWGTSHCTVTLGTGRASSGISPSLMLSSPLPTSVRSWKQVGILQSLITTERAHIYLTMTLDFTTLTWRCLQFLLGLQSLITRLAT